MVITRYYQTPALNPGSHQVTCKKLQAVLGSKQIQAVTTENCFNICVEDGKDLTAEEQKKLLWVVTTPFEGEKTSRESFLRRDGEKGLLIEIGPRLNFSTAFSTNAVSICHAVGLKQISRIEVFRRFLVQSADSSPITAEEERRMLGVLHDRMTECRYTEPVSSFDLDVKQAPWYEVDVMTGGKEALMKANTELGLAFDDWDLEYYTKMFRDQLGRNPTSVECFDLAQSNSEHSRHWFFKGKMVIDGKEHEDSLFKMVMKTQDHSNDNNVIKFSDNSSAIQGFQVPVIHPGRPAVSSRFQDRSALRHVIFTAETHNFPTGVAPFPGATTGTGGRIRDVQAAGRGAHVVAGTAGYSFGNLSIQGYDLPWEDKTFEYPSNMATPVDICIEASNGASDYGNKFGEPVLAGFARSFGMRLADGERKEWVKPIMFSGGIGQLEGSHITKDQPAVGMEVVKLGGPVYRIGVGGGAASSVIAGENKEELDFGAVQRGDAEMEQKLNRVIRACIEMAEDNPIRSIHDQGAGGNGNVLKEIVEPAGAVIRTREFQLGDPTISVMELWGAEYQESNAVLVKSADSGMLRDICTREKCPVSFVGEVTGDGKIVLEESEADCPGDEKPAKRQRDGRRPVDLDLECVLGSMPRKTFNFDTMAPNLTPLSLPDGLSVREALERVLRLPSVASKRYLTNKVDRSVTGLVAQQQCVGPLHTPLADVAVTALSHFGTVGSATAIGEQPIKGLLDPAAGARMSVGEALTNLVFARVTDLKDVKCSGNWMWPAKLPGEGAALFHACRAMCDVMQQLGVAVDGGKDSLSMAAKVGQETVKSPGTLVVSVYAACPDITATVTPDLKCPGGKGALLYVDMSGGKHRLGGTALAQCYSQLGDQSPDMDEPQRLVQGFNTTQKLIEVTSPFPMSSTEGVLTAGHDVSDGGLVTCLLEMAFAGNYGLAVDITADNKASPVDVLFAEELGLVLETTVEQADGAVARFTQAGVSCQRIGHSQGEGTDAEVKISVNGTEVLADKMAALRDVWEETSFQLERLQTNPQCVAEEEAGLQARKAPPYKLTFDPSDTPQPQVSVNGSAESQESRPKVAVIREEGSNGDREMVAAFHMAGFEVWDVNMHDLCTGKVTLDRFRGVVFVGGFSYADVMGSAKGWAATLLFNPTVRAQFSAFRARSDTFSLGICNGCQLMGLLGWVAPDQGQVITDGSGDQSSPQQGVFLAYNVSERFESRFVTVAIEESPALMLKGMEGSTLGIWVAHGEGRMLFKTDALRSEVEQNHLTPLRYVDDDGKPTMVYPLNPNGSPNGLAALCSPDGRHLAMMPHPERCTLTWQWPWMPQDWHKSVKTSPWLRMFQNAYVWCMENQ
ncbi:PFAS [Branchiostoma lanceolatum]|uniref:Phosphoribosylformylglycinamidine synthase n=1 Tax=Branchiostoma lanceolatum TaxID=7740 RepID=A0A8K0A3A4_BRALA|nr:PFAS [Branchiostoma lanceolatum]